MSKKIVLTPECEVCDGLRDLVKTSAGYYCKEHQPMKTEQKIERTLQIKIKCGYCDGTWKVDKDWSPIYESCIDGERCPECLGEGTR